MSLVRASERRLSGELPVFPGRTIVEQLQNGRRAAEAALRRYVPNFRYDREQAAAVMHEVGAWAERRSPALTEALDPATNPSNTLPQQLQLELGAVKTQQFVIASFTQAAVGLGPWQSGEIGRLIGGAGTEVGGTRIDQQWARQDAQLRLRTFGIIVSLERRGELKAIFRPPQPPTAGLGALATGTLVLLAIVTAILAAAVVSFLVIDRQMARNNQLMRDICLRAEGAGNKAVMDECVRAARGLQDDPFSKIADKLLTGALVFGVGFVLVRWLLEQGSEAFAEWKEA